MNLLSRDQARAHYDRFGAKQDRQAYYEDPVTMDLVRHASFEKARAVVELGCGTGRFAETLLRDHLAPTATYVGLDLSSTMVVLAEARLVPFGPRAAVRLTDGSPYLDMPDTSCDRFVSNFVLDLLGEEDCQAVVAQAHRVLEPGGLLCLSSLAPGFTALSRFVAGAIRLVHAARPSLVGGCRPLELLRFVDETQWTIRHQDRLAPYGIPSAVLVAERRSDRANEAGRRSSSRSQEEV